MKFIESLKISNYSIPNIQYHTLRIRNSCKYANINCINVNYTDLITNNPYPLNTVKCRIVYSKDEVIITYHPYKKRIINTLKLVEDNSITYNYKFENRLCINNLLDRKGECDDIIIVKNDLITDSSYSNLVLKKEDKYFTPKAPLLFGTQISNLIYNKKIIPIDIKVADIKTYESVLLINTMMELKDGIEIPISSISY